LKQVFTNVYLKNTISLIVAIQEKHHMEWKLFLSALLFLFASSLANVEVFRFLK